jgi:hypothetical protein
MWLVNCTTLKLEYFIGSNIPKYTILSHTWEEEEVTFHELDQHHPGNLELPEARLRQLIYDTTPKGYHKIWETCFKARKHGFQYAWIDTCCINKDSSAELTESINSMFQWYQNAEECYVYLSDLPSKTSAKEGFPKCKWFTRGWTLQELIAPKKVLFYDQAWKCVGSKTMFCDMISKITNIDKGVLRGTTLAWDFPTATRMSWAARRQTTRVEDIAYCLLGIFQVNLPMIYGEGINAFFRLQEEIVRHNNDLTIFTWEQGEGQGLPCNLFALSPRGFADTGLVLPIPQIFLDPVFSITNKGLRFENFTMLRMISIKDTDSGLGVSDTSEHSPISGMTYYIPLCASASDLESERSILAMELRKIRPDLFVRSGKLLKIAWYRNLDSGPRTSFYICLGPPPLRDEDWRAGAIHFPRQVFQIEEALPESHWDARDMFFYVPSDDFSLVMFARGVVNLDDSVVTLMLCIRHNIEPKSEDTQDSQVQASYAIFDAEQHNKLASWLVRHKRFGHDFTWDDVQIDHPEILDFTNQLEVVANGIGYQISVSVTESIAPSISEESISSVEFTVKKLRSPTLERTQRHRERQSVGKVKDLPDRRR